MGGTAGWKKAVYNGVHLVWCAISPNRIRRLGSSWLAPPTTGRAIGFLARTSALRGIPQL